MFPDAGAAVSKQNKATVIFDFFFLSLSFFSFYTIKETITCGPALPRMSPLGSEWNSPQFFICLFAEKQD